MKWSLNELRQASEQPIEFDETIELENILHDRRSDLIECSPIHVRGIISHDSLGILGYARVTGYLILPSSRSLEPAKIDLDFDFTEHYVSSHDSDISRFEQEDVVITLEDDILDLDQVVADNVLLQIPMQILTQDEQSGTALLPKGDEWAVQTEDQNLKQDDDAIDPRMAALKDFFKK